MAAPNQNQNQRTKPHPAVTVVLISLLTVHVFAMFLWITPGNPLRNAVFDPLRSYVLPWFQQSWSLFAPNPISAARYLEVRAVPADLTESEWVSASDVELEGLHHNLLPTTAAFTTNKLAENGWDRFEVLAEDEREVLGWHYHSDAWNRMKPEFTSASEVRVDRALEYDQAITAYATQFLKAKALLNDGDHVQYRFIKVSVPTFDNRLTQENTSEVLFTSGRRPATELPHQDSEGFAKALEAFK